MTETGSYGREYGSRIRDARVSASLTQADLATALGCTQAQVSRLEAGRRAQTVEQLLQVADAIRCDPSWLLTGSEPGQHQQRFPPLGASVRPEPHSGDPVTAEPAAKITTNDLSARARAERILSLVADHGEKIIDLAADPLDIPDYVLLTLVQAGEALVRLAELDAQQPLSVELLLDGTGDLWVLTADDQFECQTSHCEPQTLEQIQDAFGVARRFTAAPPADR